MCQITSDDLEQFSKLKGLVDVDIKLFLTDQVYNEVYRNREAKIKDALGNFKEINLSFPAFFKNYEEYHDFNRKYIDLKRIQSDWLKKVEEDVINERSPADNVLQEFFQSIPIIACGPEIISRGVMRYNAGNPPGKDKKYGDAISWECLLETVPNHENLFFISADKDYASLFDKEQFSPFLYREWKEEKHSKIIFFKSLVDFLNKYYKDIRLSTEQEKDDLIQGLERSPNFATTHSIISELTNNADWNTGQIEDLCRAAINNSQVFWILSDDDVNTFYKALLRNWNFGKPTDDSIIQINERLIEIEQERQNESGKSGAEPLPF